MHTHTHTHTCTHTPWAVSHSRININALLFYFLIIDPHTNIVFSCHPIHHMFLYWSSKLSCVSMCTFMHARTYTPHTSTSIHLQLQSHVYCLCKFVFTCSGNYQQVFLLPFALLNICMHMHTHACTQTHMHMHARSRTHTQESCFNHKRVHMYTLKWLWQSFITHTHMHTHTHIHRTGLCFVKLLSNFPVVSCCYEHTY